MNYTFKVDFIFPRQPKKQAAIYISDDHRFFWSLVRISEASFLFGVRTGLVVGGDEEEDAGTESVSDFLVFCCAKDFH